MLNIGPKCNQNCDIDPKSHVDRVSEGKLWLDTAVVSCTQCAVDLAFKFGNHLEYTGTRMY